MAAVASRSKREECTDPECPRTKHDLHFSDWQILIGPSDWEEYSSGKDGVEKYRIHNLPMNCPCPGIYELGVARLRGDGLGSRKHDSKNIEVYVGQADDVRRRLQQYGRIGGHLDCGSSTVCSDKDEKRELFKKTFSRGCSIMFRWAPMKNKMEAEKTEADLLDAYDYAWNRRGNGASRHDEIFIKFDSNGDRIGNLIPAVRKLGKSQIKFIPRLDGNHDICGASIGNGSIKGKNISGSSSVERNEIIETHGVVCGVSLEDGSQCTELPAYGRKRCELHKGRRVTETVLTDIRLPGRMENQFCNRQPPLIEGPVDEEFDICGVVNTDGAVCRNRPVSGRKRCEQHKGQRTSRQQLLTSKERCETKFTYWNDEEAINRCGVVTNGGSVCTRRPVRGRKRCEEHKGRRITRY